MNKFAIAVSLLFIIASISGCLGGEKNQNHIAVIEMKMGKIKIELYEDKAPTTTKNFIKLVNDGFYDGLIFHRIVNNFVIQGGGFYPDGTPKQSPYGTIKLETNPDLTHVDGAVAMARTNDPNSATSQFYICDGPQHFLDGQYAVFGKVIEGMDIVRTIASFDPQHTYTPQHWPKEEILEDVTMIKVYIE